MMALGQWTDLAVHMALGQWSDLAVHMMALDQWTDLAVHMALGQWTDLAVHMALGQEIGLAVCKALEQQDTGQEGQSLVPSVGSAHSHSFLEAPSLAQPLALWEAVVCTHMLVQTQEAPAEGRTQCAAGRG